MIIIYTHTHIQMYMETTKFDERDIHIKSKAMITELNGDHFIFSWTHKFAVEYHPEAYISNYFFKSIDID